MKLTRRKSKVKCYSRVKIILQQLLSTPEKAEVCILHSLKTSGNVWGWVKSEETVRCLKRPATCQWSSAVSRLQRLLKVFSKFFFFLMAYDMSN